MNAAVAVPQRSTFVTVLAWIFIVLAGFATFISLMQNAVMFFMFHGGGMDRAMAEASRGPNVPPFAALFVNYFYLVFVLFFVVSATTLASSIGLLYRRNWARIVFIVMMGLGIAWNLLGLALGAFMLTVVNGLPMHAAKGPPFALGTMVAVVMAFNALIALGFSALFAWIILKLRSPAIRAEFVAVS